MTSPRETAGDYQMVPEDDRDMPEESTPDPAGAIVAGEPHSPAPAASEDPGATAVGSAAEEPGVAGRADAESPSSVSAAGAEPGSTRASPVASDSTISGGRWHEIQAMFVDDPRSSVELAAGLADDSVEALVVSVKDHQQALLSAWQGNDARTEELRTALQHYRAFCNRLEDFSREA
jgi:hypothetical protein